VAIVIYDGDCGFCRWSLALLLCWDRVRGGRRSHQPLSLRPLPLRTGEAEDLLADLSEEQRDASWHLVVDGTRFSAGAALAPALRRLPGGRVPAALFARFPAATERAYRWVADHRGVLGRFVPSRARRWADRVIAAHGGSPAPR
jgi:predicted DCC family thiol-disulfide oxidoreductase YuxK